MIFYKLRLLSSLTTSPIISVGRKCVHRSLHSSSVLSFSRYHKHRPIPPKIMNVNTCWRYPQFGRQGIQPQKYDYFLVLDFEATCDSHTPLNNQEIIEFPCLQVDSKTFEVVSEFHEYVQPQANPKLSLFCIQLTGILQEMLDDKPVFTDVLASFLEWLSAQQLHPYGGKANSIFVTSGDWDLKVMLPAQCRLSNVPVPKEMVDWINIKETYHKSTGYYPRGIKDMAAELGLVFQGRLHSGIDDCRNIVNIMKALAGRGVIFEKTS